MAHCAQALLLLNAIIISVAAVTEKPYYTAAVFQNAIIGPPDDAAGCSVLSNRSCHGRPVEEANLMKFDSAMAQASAQDADIIVFGEGSIDVDLWNPGPWQWNYACERIPDLDLPGSGSVAPCDASDWRDFPITHNASCLARKHKLVTVISACDRQPCRNSSRPCLNKSDSDCCPTSGYELFNTQLAFSETGKLLAKYHKVHNYDTSPNEGESGPSPKGSGLCCRPPRLDLKYFDTSFGVRFGMHICFDIMFRTPGIEQALDPELGIHDFVYSTHWETTGPPMLPGVEIQQAWSRALGVNLLAANAGIGYRHAGSGIYSAGHALAAHYDPLLRRDDRLLVARVPILKQHIAQGLIRMGKQRMIAPPVPAASSQEFGVLSREVHRVQVAMVTSHGFQCKVTATLSNTTSFDTVDRFLLVSVNGFWMGKGNVPTRSCLVVRCGILSQSDCLARVSCANYHDASCPGARSLYVTASDLQASTLFDSIALEGNFKSDDVVLPIIGTSMGQLIEASAISLEEGRMHATLGKPLLNAMLYGIPKDDHFEIPSAVEDTAVLV